MYKGQVLIDIDELHRVLLKGHPTVKEGDVYITCANKENMQNMMQVIFISNKLPNDFTYEVSKEMMDIPTEEWNDKMFVISFRETDIHQIELPHAINALNDSERIVGMYKPLGEDNKGLKINFSDDTINNLKKQFEKSLDEKIIKNMDKTTVKNWLNNINVVTGSGTIRIENEMEKKINNLVLDMVSSKRLEADNIIFLQNLLTKITFIAVEYEKRDKCILKRGGKFEDSHIDLKYNIRLTDLEKYKSNIFRELYGCIRTDFKDYTFKPEVYNYKLDNISTKISFTKDNMLIDIYIPCEEKVIY